MRKSTKKPAGTQSLQRVQARVGAWGEGPETLFEDLSTGLAYSAPCYGAPYYGTFGRESA